MKKQKENSLRQFFSPTKGKFLTMVLLTGILFVLPSFGETAGSISFYVILIPLFLIDLIGLKLIGGDVISTPTILSLVIGLLVYLVEVYLISCIVIEIYLKLHKNHNEIKKTNWKSLLKQPLFWIAIWTLLFIFIIVFSLFLPDLLFVIFFISVPLILPLLCIWLIVSGILKLRKGGEVFLSVFYIIFGLLILLAFSLIYVTLLNPVY